MRTSLTRLSLNAGGLTRRDLLRWGAASGAAAVVSFGAGPAAAKEYKLTIAASHPKIFPWVGVLSSHVVPESNKRLAAMGSKDRIKWTESYGGALYSFKDTLEAVKDGITDAGWVGTLWEGSKMPYQNITYFTPFVSDDLPGLMTVMNKLHKELPVLRKAWEKQNQVFLGASGVETYHLMTKFPVKSIDDLKGRKILAPGPSANWIASLGATPVNGALTTYYNQMQTGVADGCITIITGFYPNKMYEVAPYVTLVGIGAHMTGGFSVNKDVWDGLSKDVQKVLSELGEEYSRIHVEQVMARYTKFLASLRQKAKVSTLPAAEKAKWIKILPNIAGQWAKPLPEGRAVLNAYMEAVRASGVKPGRDWDKEA